MRFELQTQLLEGGYVGDNTVQGSGFRVKILEGGYVGDYRGAL